MPFTYDLAQLLEFVLPANRELNMVFHFELMELDAARAGQSLELLRFRPWSFSELKGTISRLQPYKRAEGFWNAYVSILLLIVY
jgi:oligo-1,6-glucosidase